MGLPPVEDALAAALEMQSEIAAWCAVQNVEPKFVLKLGVHHGPVIAVNANERLDYFGGTVNVAARLGRESRGGDVVVLASVLEEPGVAKLIAARAVEVERFTAELRGVQGALESSELRPST